MERANDPDFSHWQLHYWDEIEESFDLFERTAGAYLSEPVGFTEYSMFLYQGTMSFETKISKRHKRYLSGYLERYEEPEEEPVEESGPERHETPIERPDEHPGTRESSEHFEGGGDDDRGLAPKERTDVFGTGPATVSLWPSGPWAPKPRISERDRRMG